MLVWVRILVWPWFIKLHSGSPRTNAFFKGQIIHYSYLNLIEILFAIDEITTISLTTHKTLYLIIAMYRLINKSTITSWKAWIVYNRTLTRMCFAIFIKQTLPSLQIRIFLFNCYKIVKNEDIENAFSQNIEVLIFDKFFRLCWVFLVF